ncbi:MULTISPECIES: PAS domain-containing sensor histidine kinase [Sinorhizobium]|uniref:histidine kinase n=1 Tax=Sinorhizobium americanum TaxID=194963 RepID=A0A2S3YTS5_9HYPH|nr:MULTISPECIES: PAS domain-containing sensor histidine kinase [Sinorhizobium]PDT38066.1 PAS domain-containing sensor histidine kinase [Sinorhizobium sp. FG01]POH35013.1 PAS domain-containing sensor histidine kinase [Sinorhizobium americanum]
MEDLEDLYENAPCGYLSLGADGIIIKVNQTLCRWLDANSHDLLGERFYDLLSVPGKIFYETHFAPLLRMQGFFNEVALDLVSPGGKQIPVLVNALERQAPDGSLLFTRVTLFQASERRRYERELLDARNAADRAKRELERLNSGLETQLAEGVTQLLQLQRGLIAEQEIARLREQFVAILGHDLRNPLSSIVAGLNILSKEPQSERARRVLALMSNSTARMFRLIHDMLDFARLKSGAGIAVQIQRCDLCPALEQVIEELRNAYPGRMIESCLSLPEHVYCDSERIAQVVSNLLANALSHGAKDAPIRVDAAVSGEDLTISVVNKGQPVRQDIKERLFQPFFRGQTGTQGLGLGLYISREIISSHRGSLDVTSNPNETRFFFNIPIKPEAL